MIHPVGERIEQLWYWTRWPILGRWVRRGRTHYAGSIGTHAILMVVFHSKVVSKLMSDGSGQQLNALGDKYAKLVKHTKWSPNIAHLAIVGVDSTRVIIGTDSLLESLANDSALERRVGDKLSIIVRYLLDQHILAVVEKVGQRLTAVLADVNFILFRPYDRTNDCNLDVEWRVKLINDN